MSDLPPARLHPRDARDRLAIVGVHARRAARGAAEIARGLWGVSLVGAACVGAMMSILAVRPTPRPHPYEMSRAVQQTLQQIELNHRLANELEVVEVPTSDGKGTIRTLARKRKPGAATPTVPISILSLPSISAPAPAAQPAPPPAR